MKKLLSVLLIAMLVVVGCGKSDSAEENASNGGSSSKTEKVCNIERDHIHIEDLSKEELNELNIQYTLGMVRTFTDSKIKSIVFNGKEYDYKEIIECLTDYDKMTNFIAQNADYEKMTKEDVANLMSYSEYKENYLSHAFSLTDKNDPTKASASITVSWEFPKNIKEGQYVDPIYYGQSHDDKDYIMFSAPDDINEDFGFILEDGRYVHALAINTYDKWYLVSYIYVTSRTQDRK